MEQEEEDRVWGQAKKAERDTERRKRRQGGGGEWWCRSSPGAPVALPFD